MNVTVLRLTDQRIGKPLCLALTAVRGMFKLLRFRARAPLPAPRKILIIKLSEMGSTVLAYPSVAELRRRIPGAEIFFLVFDENCGIMEALEMTPPDHILRIRTDSVSGLITSGFRVLRRLRRERIDTTIDMDFFSRFSAAFAYLVCRGNRVGFHRYTDEGLYRGNLMTHRVLYSPHMHTSEVFLALTEALFSEGSEDVRYKGRVDPAKILIPRLRPSPEALESVRAKLLELNIGPNSAVQPILLINPNSSQIFPLRKWPLGQFKALCALLITKHPTVRLVITGSRSEQEEAEGIVKYLGEARCVSLAGKTTFPELLALYSLAAAMVTNDSGPAHFASLLDLPTLVLFGPETPRLYRPLGKNVHVLYAELACSPCVSVYNDKKSPCKENVCMKSIKVQEVLQKVLEVLPQKA